MAEATVYMRDLQGPFKGLERPYLRHAAENAHATGYAEYVNESDVPEARGAVTPTEEAEPVQLSLPDDFPGREPLLHAGLTTLDAVRATEDLTAIDGIGKKTAVRILEALGD